MHALILLLVFTFLNIAAIYMLTQAYFLAVIQVLVYAGAILVLFAFVVMFLNLREFTEHGAAAPRARGGWCWCSPRSCWPSSCSCALGITWASVERRAWTPEAVGCRRRQRASHRAWSLFNDMLLPFEVASLILLVGMVGAIVLAKKEDAGNMALREWTGEEESSQVLVDQEV